MPSIADQIAALTKQGKPAPQTGNQLEGTPDGINAVDANGNKLNRGQLPASLVRQYINSQTNNKWGDAAPLAPGAYSTDPKTGAPVAAPPPDPSVIAGITYEANRQSNENQRQRGLAANIVAGNSLLGMPNLKKKTLMGY